MPFLPRQEPFLCEHCGRSIEPLEHGSYRNHCPFCLYSKHVDDRGPGDRASGCGGLMPAVGLDQDGKKGWILIHRCERCGKEVRNKAAPDDELQNGVIDGENGKS
ncbi:RNHCP domain-containing protein [Candidatus Peregrinibacteria bacterium]|nr:RNHCP domain-containing protein [Candidatus Peregrinibacteria bacterium]MBI3816572.1 RNHCP domain-containing protein [Candidatus Peregrinibacteria bacterium]